MARASAVRDFLIKYGARTTQIEVSSRGKLDFRFDLIVTAERVGAYKPDLPHFQTGIADLAALDLRD